MIFIVLCITLFILMFITLMCKKKKQKRCATCYSGKNTGVMSFENQDNYAKMYPYANEQNVWVRL